MKNSANKIPEKIKTIHLIAACGTGMGALACMLKDLGFEVTGSDQNVYPPMSRFLADKKIPIARGFKAENLSPRPDLVVVGNAVSKDNPEVQQMEAMGIAFCSMPQAINHFVARDKKVLLVTGTHGKTTTSSLLAWVLFEAGLDPSFIIGGILQDFVSNYRLGRGDLIVLEGDEYDTAYFDKGPKFLHYDPFLTVLTSVEFDHADIFRDLAHVKEVFKKLATGIAPENGLFAFDADKNIDRVLAAAHCRIARYGQRSDSAWRLGPVEIKPPVIHFEVYYNNRLYGDFETRMPGTHNLLNTLAVIACAAALSIPKAAIKKAVATFGGIKRRQEIRGKNNGITVIDDFAHHPTAVKETIKAIKPFCTKGRLIAVFEPRTNSSMRQIFQDVYPHCFDQADLVCIRKPPLLSKIPADERFSSEKLVADLNQAGQNAFYFPDTDAILDFLVEKTIPGDTILIMSNGGFDNIHERLLKRI
jgi:UDP-N-acetylmuramate: L-alanyl-gamma-D-glutamyl-meso-diaminopimelate ligase